MLTAKVYEAIKSDVEYVQDTVIRYVKAKSLIGEYLKSAEFITNEKSESCVVLQGNRQELLRIKCSPKGYCDWKEKDV